MPLLSVPFSVPFTAVVRAVADANDREEARELLKVARLYELLRQSIPAGRSGSGLLERLGAELGVRLCLVDPATGRSLFDDEETQYAAAIAAGYDEHGSALPGMLRLRLSGESDAAPSAVAVAVPAPRPTALVVEPLHDELPSTILLQHAAAAGALALAQLTAQQEARRRAAADLFARLMERRLSEAAASEALSEFGLALDGLVVAAVRPDVTEFRPDSAPDLVRLQVQQIALWRPPHLLLLVPDRAVPEARDGPLLDRFRAVGISGPLVLAERMPEAVGEAIWALAAAETDALPGVRFGNASVLVPRTPGEARLIVGRVLGPLLANDTDHHSDYLGTVRCFLTHDRSWQATAAELHIHKQTLGYRIRKIESLTGRGFGRTEHLAEWWVALRAHEMLLLDLGFGGPQGDL